MFQIKQPGKIYEPMLYYWYSSCFFYPTELFLGKSNCYTTLFARWARVWLASLY